MPEQTFPIDVVCIDYICDICKEGKMIQQGSMNLTDSSNPKYPHTCDKCGHKQEFTEKISYY